MGFEITEDCEAACTAAATHTFSINSSTNSSGQQPDPGLHGDRAPGHSALVTDDDALMVLALLVQFGFAYAGTVLRLSTLAECALTVAQQALGEQNLVVTVEEGQEIEIVEPRRPPGQTFTREDIRMCLKEAGVVNFEGGVNAKSLAVPPEWETGSPALDGT
eukprot:365711-Alexandrium_andersonii.AAC.1